VYIILSTTCRILHFCYHKICMVIVTYFIAINIHSYIHTYIHTYIHNAYIHTYIRTYIHTYIRTYIHTYIYTYIHMHTHMYIPTYIHAFHRYISVPQRCQTSHKCTNIVHNCYSVRYYKHFKGILIQLPEDG
jgi:hypothetical protein